MRCPPVLQCVTVLLGFGTIAKGEGWFGSGSQNAVTYEDDFPTPRHQQAKEALLNHIQRDRWVWNRSHPRYALLNALYGYLRYRESNIEEVLKWKELYERLPFAQKKVARDVIHYDKSLDRVERLYEENAQVADAILNHGLQYYQVDRKELEQFAQEAEADKREPDRKEVLQAMRHFVRDWSDDGTHERMETFPWVLETIDGLFPSRHDNPDNPIKVIIPGSGLGKLAHEIGDLGGFEVTSNEWSMYMSVAYRYMQTLKEKESVTYYPYIPRWSHQINRANLERGVKMPNTAIDNTAIVHVEGDFTHIFKAQAGQFDVVVTLFFIDTAWNLLTYMDSIKAMLKPGGYWLNLGPLLYRAQPYVQLTLEEILDVSEHMGFEFLDIDPKWGNLTVEGRKARGVEARYSFDLEALIKHAYYAQMWVARKTEDDLFHSEL
ncbi:N2227-domain-containing protein [Eremomyces bilateralis CBS 781.70]|uniref:N2227-domain-containing protein n=1 Tax=Eremomyces bilateralis CBS 781.70 TaxID=1392243 RepID=A0A6G1GCA3_9PEZI|nr:N2227-domain-containing protein [Eremomyces bilateralis CBS 781.70]KAF1815530.1 N2227-domain-containing protein [Eremomyces bilateralis CBS 781.70]